MSIKIMSRVWDESPSKGSELLLLLAIADYANESGVAWPKTETLAHKVRMSERQVQRMVKALVDQRQLKVEKNAGPKGTNLYRICHPRQDVTPDIAMSPYPDTDVTPTPDIAMSPEPSVEPSREPSPISIPRTPRSGDMQPEQGAQPESNPPKPTRITYPPAFETFWSRYPTGHGVKKLAYDEWKKLRPDAAMVEEILDGIDNWKHSQRWRDGYIKDAERFLKHRMWESEPPATQVKPTTSRAPGKRGYTSDELMEMYFETYGGGWDD